MNVIRRIIEYGNVIANSKSAYSLVFDFIIGMITPSSCRKGDISVNLKSVEKRFGLEFKPVCMSISTYEVDA